MFKPRCLASFWIVCGHFAPRLEESVFTPVRHRGNAAVNFFIILSGFITHWVYAKRLLSPKPGQVARFYVRRIGRVVLTTWFAMVLGLVVVVVQLRGRFPEFGHLLRCFLFLETWRDPIDWCPNGQTWTVAALLPSWLLYPVTCRLVFATAEHGGLLLLSVLAVMLWSTALAPMIWCFVRQGYWLSNVQGIWSYIWPPSQIGDFALGAVAAETARRFVASGSSVLGRFSRPAADVALLLVLLICFMVPSGGAREGFEPFFGHGLGLFFAAFLVCSSIPPRTSGSASLLRHPSLRALGAYSFEVYLFQYPVHELFVAVGDISGTYSMRNLAGKYNNNSCGFIVYVFVLWLFAGLYMELVEHRLVSWLKRISEEEGPNYRPLERLEQAPHEMGQPGVAAPL